MDPSPTRRRATFPTGCAALQLPGVDRRQRAGCRPGDQAVEIDATIEIGGVIRFLSAVLCRDCAEVALNDHDWLPTLSDEDI